MNNIFGNNLRFLRKKNKLSQPQLGKLIGKSESTIQMYEQGKRMPIMATVTTLSLIFKIDINDLVNKDLRFNSNSDDILSKENACSNLKPITTNFIKIPIYGAISCGTGGFNEDLIEDYFNVPQNMLRQNKDYFGMYAKGDSMIGENINDGDLLIFEKSQSINNKQVGCFCIDENTATCKVFQKTNDMIYLYPANNDYQPIPITIENTMFHVVGILAFVLNNRLNDF